MLDKPKILDPSRWPKRLFEIPEPPKKLWVLGNLPNPEMKWLTIVGSRRYTRYGEDVCKTLIEGLKGKPIVIVSGLAVGMDSIALEAGIEAGLKCVGAPGSGLDEDSISPAQNISLSEKIIKSGGCLISEFDPDMKATLWSFPKRNRIMAGLSHAVLVIEAEKKSGTLITSRLATEYNRDVFTVPGSIFSKNTEGSHMLIKLGATPITSSEDLLDALGFAEPGTNGDLFEEDSTSPPSSLNMQKIKKATQDEIKKKKDRQIENLSDLEKIVMFNLKEPKSRELLSMDISMPQQKLNEILSLLELKGLIKDVGGYVRLN